MANPRFYKIRIEQAASSIPSLKVQSTFPERGAYLALDLTRMSKFDPIS